MDSSRYIVGPVAKALLVLDTVGEGEDGVRLSEVALRTGLPKTTAFRYLCTLEAAGYVDCDPAAEVYRVGARLRALGRAADPAKRLRAAALPIMTELRDRFEETVNLGVLRGGNIVYVEIVECRQRLRLQARVGGVDPLHSTALGRAILAGLPAGEREKLLSRQLDARTVSTVRSKDAVLAELAHVARRGWSLERGENEVGAVCIGAAITDGAGRPLGALSLSAPEMRMPEQRVHEVGPALVAGADLVGRRLGER
ncbi:MAG: IclR family transcriptional regulator [Acetobacteraceae bacterium]|nr:IclR family transcriptional regulator [Acetobacteraceae bacterium]